MGEDDPTAAIPSVPPPGEKCPIIKVSTRFESCSRMPVTATGNANRGMSRHSEPWRMSISGGCFFICSVFKTYFCPSTSGCQVEYSAILSGVRS